MGPDNAFSRIFIFLGIIVTNTGDVDCLHSHRRQIKEYNSKVHQTHPRLSHDRLKTISKHVLKTFDTSCVHIPLPKISNGMAVKIHKRRIHMENIGTKEYLMAEFKCQKGFALAKKYQHGKMFCSRSKWIGKKPVCEISVKGMIRNDAEMWTFPRLPLRLKECPPDHKIRCKHLCYILNGEPTCGCPAGFKEVGSNNCQDINECEDPKIKSQCPYGCFNSVGSYHCPTSSEDYLQADQPSRDSIIEQTDEEAGDEYEDYEEGDYDENYDENESDKNSTEQVNSKTENKITLSAIENNNASHVIVTENSEKNKNESAGSDMSINSDTIEHRFLVAESDKSIKSDIDRRIDTKENNIDSDSYDDEDYEEGDYEDEYDDEKAKMNITEEAATTQESILSSPAQSSSTEGFTTTPSKIANMDASKELSNDISKEIDKRIDIMKTRNNDFITPDYDFIGNASDNHDMSESSVTMIITDNITTVSYPVEVTTPKRVDSANEEDENYDDDYEDEIEDTKTATTPVGTSMFEPRIIHANIDEIVKNSSEESSNFTIKNIATVHENHYDVNEEMATSIPEASSTYHIITTSSPAFDTNSSTLSYDDEKNSFITRLTNSSHKSQDRSSSDNDMNSNESETDEEYDDEDYEDYDDTTTTTSATPMIIITTESSGIMNSGDINPNRRVDLNGETINPNEYLINRNGNEKKFESEKTNNRTSANDEDDYDDEEYDDETSTTGKPLLKELFETTTASNFLKTTTPPSVDELITQVVPTEQKTEKSDSDSPRRSKPTGDDDYDDDDDYEEYEDSKTEGSELANKIVKKCQEGYKLDEKNECADIDECDPETNPCSDKCQNTVGSYICSCSSGFKQSPADYHICQDIDECQDKPCSHTCINSEGSYKCDCPRGLTLHETTCLNLTCSHGETKINGKIQCTCPSGYVLGFDNRTCEDVNECLLVNDCAHSCHNTEGSYECSCRPGFVLENERLCIDIDECQGDNACPHNCENLPGSFKCSCREGYDYVNTTNTCIDIDECGSRDLHECNQICINYEGGYECGCRSGFKLGTDDATCEDIRECAVNNGNCSQICEDLPGSYACKCIKNYSLNEDKRTCRIVNPCLSENGGCSHHCLHINDSVRCDCPEKYELTIDKKTCVQINPCTIRNGGCSHFCEFVNGQANCLCPVLFTLQNKTHCTEINPCWENNGGCSHICSFEDHKQSCLCPLTHEILNRTHCLEKNPCLMENGGCSDTCNFSNGVLSCSCPEHYRLEGKTCYRNDPCLVGNGGCSHECFSDEDGHVKCLCPQNFVLRKNQKVCVPQDLCLLDNGNCSHTCDSSANRVTCSCPEGYQLQNGTQCVQLDPCSKNNGGCSDICENIFGKANCACPDNYALEEDQKNCVVIDNCLEDNGGCSHFCKTVDEQIQCFCPERYNLVNQTKCVPLNPCLINNGGCSHECSPEGDIVVCSCPRGYKLESKQCILINPCDRKNGGCSHVCRSINGLIACECPPGFELINKTCFKKDPCSIDNGGCSHGCTNVRGQAKCSCPPGYKLFAKTCLDDDPCKKNNGGCSHRCESIKGRRECSCPAGYLLRPNKRVCKEVNECRVDRGGCSHGCKNLPGSFQCTCPHGLKLDPIGNKTCVDVDECRIDNGKCEMICRNSKGGHKCDCPEGYTLQNDKRSCKLGAVTQCRVPLAPKYGIMRCSDQIMEHGTLVPSGTRCNFWCNEGYKLQGRSPRQCSSTGKWESDEPKCIVATCPKLPPIKNGWYLPGVCNSGRTYPGESCEIYCRKGFKPRRDIEKYVCDASMQWMPSVRIENLQDACVSGIPNIHLKCPKNGHIEFILPEGQQHMAVKIPRPESSVDWNYVTSQPSWGTRLETTLPAGRTEVRFTAVSPTDFNTTASCHLVINVLDKELPKVMDCPSNIERTLPRGQNMQVVHWREPQFGDNVGIATVYKSREPGGEFGLGLHHITYVGSDEAGNRAFCHFSINIRDDLELEESNSVQQYSSTYTNHNSAGKYRAVLICPSGVQYMSNPPDSYNNMLTSEAGCYWRHVKVTRPMQPQSFKVPKVYGESRLPSNMRSSRRVFFKWN